MSRNVVLSCLWIFVVAFAFLVVTTVAVLNLETLARRDAIFYEYMWRQHGKVAERHLRHREEVIAKACSLFTGLPFYASGAIAFQHEMVVKHPEWAAMCYELHDVPVSMRHQ